MGETGGRERRRMVKLLFGLAALGSLVTGLIIYLFAETFGLDDFTAKLVAAAFLIAGLGDYLVLRNWDRIFRGRR